MAVQVLLSTHNGEKYVGALLKSLLEQDYPLISILVRDDGSTDNTVSIIQELAVRYNSIQLIEGTNLGYPKCFFKLLEFCSSSVDYLAFCDQDDIWLPSKISRAINHLEQYPNNIVKLYCSSLVMVDKDLRIIKPINICKKELSFYNALVEASAWGCTSVINQATRKMLIVSPPQNIIYHDWWVYLLVSAFGKVIYDDTPSILYRRHSTTVSDEPKNFFHWWQIRIRRYLKYRNLQPILKQAKEFQQLYGDLMDEKLKTELNKFIDSRKHFFTRLKYLTHCPFYRQNAIDNLIMKCLSIINRL